MALQKCPECDSPVSDSSAWCPGCGYGSTMMVTSQKPLKAIAVVLLAMVLVQGALFLATSQILDIAKYTVPAKNAESDKKIVFEYKTVFIGGMISSAMYRAIGRNQWELVNARWARDDDGNWGDECIFKRMCIVD